MTDVAIRTEKLSKRYRIGKLKERGDGRSALLWRPKTFSYLASTFRAPGADEITWALKDVSFEVDQGEVMGVIGRNGAGKSTLLKVLSRITEPTSGRAHLHGRVGSLLEVGTGFHPELTGRENIYLSGAILGMKRVEVESKFDEIVAFAEIERFLDTPVKRFSSGMYVRLAFAVAAHLESEILLMDEVLAVGDTAFQKKCLGKIGDVATQGRTILFVSHNLVAVQSLCRQAIWIDQGVIASLGESRQTVADYLAAANWVQSEKEWSDPAGAPGNEKIRLRRVAIRPAGGEPTDRITMETPLQLEVEFWNLIPGAELDVGWRFFTDQNVVAFTTTSLENGSRESTPARGRGLVRCVCSIPAQLLNEGGYRLTLLIYQNRGMVIFRDDEALAFEVVNEGIRPGFRFNREPGAVRPLLEWETGFVPDR